MENSRAQGPFEIKTPEEKEILANALGVYMDYLTQIGEGVMEGEKSDEIKGMAKDVLGGTMKDTIALRQRLVKHCGFDPTYDS